MTAHSVLLQASPELASMPGSRTLGKLCELAAAHQAVLFSETGTGTGCISTPVSQRSFLYFAFSERACLSGCVCAGPHAGWLQRSPCRCGRMHTFWSVIRHRPRDPGRPVAICTCTCGAGCFGCCGSAGACSTLLALSRCSATTTKRSTCAAYVTCNSLSVELHVQGLLSHAMCTKNAGPLGTDRVSSFLLLDAYGAPAMRLHSLTSRLLRSKPTNQSNTGTRSHHSGLLFEQQWHAAQPVVGSVDGNSLGNRAHVRRLRVSIKVRSRMGVASVLLQSHAGKEAALVCAAVLQKVQAGSLSYAWVTRAAQLAGTFARLVPCLLECPEAQGITCNYLHSFSCAQVLRQGGRKQAPQAQPSGVH